MKKEILKLTLFMLFGVAFSAMAQKSQSIVHYNLDNGLILEGYDPVAYFTLNKALEGKKAIFLKLEGVTYRFFSEENKSLFSKNPKKYEPQFGGWCAYALGEKNEKVDINPETFKIVNGKLYLFFNSWGNNTLLKWNKNENNLKIAADKNWLALNK
jgi:YHS domain-containing protein